MEVEIIKGRYRKNYKSLKLKVAAYVRVSTELEEQISSFESQRKYYTAKIYRNSNWKYAGIYEDYGISARSVKNREGFNRMIQDALDGKIDLILTKSISRFARNTVDSIEYVRLLKEHNIGVQFEEEGIYTLDMQSEMLLTILSSVAQQESVNASNRTKLAIQMRHLDGKNRKKSVVYGYSYKNKRLVVNNKEAEIVKRIFNLYTSGTSVPQICKILNEEKIKSQYSKKWIPNYVYLVLRCEKYIGILKFGKTYKYENLRILPDDIFYKARKKMKNNKAVLKREPDYFPGIVRCGFCGKVQGYYSGKKLFSDSSCRDVGCKLGLNVGVENVDRVLLGFQNELLENYKEILGHKNEKERFRKRNIRRINKNYYNEAIYDLDQQLKDRINKFEFINKINDLDNEYKEKLNDIESEDIDRIKLNRVLDLLKDRLLSIDSFPAEEASKELIDKLVKYIQFGERLKYNYKNRFNCRIVLKVDENYSSLSFRHKIDLSSLCENDNYIVLWKFFSFYMFKQRKKYIKVKIVLDKRDVEVK